MVSPARETARDCRVLLIHVALARRVIVVHGRPGKDQRTAHRIAVACDLARYLIGDMIEDRAKRLAQIIDTRGIVGESERVDGGEHFGRDGIHLRVGKHRRALRRDIVRAFADHVVRRRETVDDAGTGRHAAACRRRENRRHVINPNNS